MDTAFHGSSERSSARRNTAALEQHVRKRIADGTWPIGYRLPTERELVQQFGLARNTLRKVMNALANEGVITRHVGRGTFVADRPSNAALTPAQLLLQRIHGASPTEVMELRLMLEPQFVQLAATRASSEDLARIFHCLMESELTSTVLDFEYWDGMLHQAILSAAHNTLLSDLYEALNGVRKQPEWELMKQRSLTDERLELYRAQHRVLYDALRHRDPDAAADAVRTHLLSVQASMGGKSALV